MNLYNKIYNAVNEGIQKALLIDPDQNDVSINYSYSKINNWTDPLLLEFVDLGLPSGTLWCDHNLGATCKDTSVSWYGNYYAWGETEPKENYYWHTYSNKFCNQERRSVDIKLCQYNTKIEKGMNGYIDNILFLLPEDDAVNQKYKQIKDSKIAKEVKMPTKEQLDELKNCPTEWVTDYNDIDGLNGRIFYGSNGNSIFIPAAGSFYGSSFEFSGGTGNLWSKSLYSGDPRGAYAIGFGSITNEVGWGDRYIGMPVRGVLQLK